MIDPQYWSIELAAGLVLILGVAVLFPGITMFWLRGGMHGGEPPSRTYFVTERSFVMAAVVFTAMGFELLAQAMPAGAGYVLASIGAATYLFAGVLIVAAEALALTLGFDKVINLIAVYVIAAFLAQAIIGVALLQSGLVAAWIGWATMAWNMAWLTGFAIFRPSDIYYPFAHHTAPLLIGIGLLLSTGTSTHAQADVSILIDRPPDDVFARLIDFGTWPQWGGGNLISMEQVSAGPLQVGTQLRQMNGTGNKAIETLVQVTQLVPGRALGIERPDLRGTFTLEPVATGTRLSASFEVEATGFSALMYRLLLKQFVAADLRKFEQLMLSD